MSNLHSDEYFYTKVREKPNLAATALKCIANWEGK